MIRICSYEQPTSGPISRSGQTLAISGNASCRCSGRGPLHVAERGEQAQRSPALRCHWFATVNRGNLTDL
jgi:hypothetical protein